MPGPDQQQAQGVLRRSRSGGRFQRLQQHLLPLGLPAHLPIEVGQIQIGGDEGRLHGHCLPVGGFSPVVVPLLPVEVPQVEAAGRMVGMKLLYLFILADGRGPELALPA